MTNRNIDPAEETTTIESSISDIGVSGPLLVLGSDFFSHQERDYLRLMVKQVAGEKTALAGVYLPYFNQRGPALIGSSGPTSILSDTAVENDLDALHGLGNAVGLSQFGRISNDASSISSVVELLKMLKTLPPIFWGIVQLPGSSKRNDLPDGCGALRNVVHLSSELLRSSLLDEAMGDIEATCECHNFPLSGAF